MTLPILPFERYAKQAEHNQELLRETCFPNPCETSNINYKDWNMTVVFYTALQYIQSYLTKNDYKLHKTHEERNEYLKTIRDSKMSKVLPDYLALYRASRYSRYTPCSYHYIDAKDLCYFSKFAFQRLPKTLGLI